MMNHPPLNDLMKKVDCRYTLVVEVSKRARQLIDNAQPLVECESDKPVSIAVLEVLNDKIKYTRNFEGEE